MPAEQPMPQMVAEARVYPNDSVRTCEDIYDEERCWCLLKDGTWSRRILERFDSADLARSALAKAQEAAGVYARPEGATCGGRQD